MLQVSGNTMQQAEKFNYLVVVFTSDGRWNKEIATRSSEANAVLPELYRPVVSDKTATKQETKQETKQISDKTRAFKHRKVVSF